MDKKTKLSKDVWGDRMKGYEMDARLKFEKDSPVLLRLDGKAFHTYTKGMERPYDLRLSNAMKETMKYLCEEIQDVRFGYTQSDEITLVLTADVSEDYHPWFDWQAQKLISVASSLCTFKFNELMYEHTGKPGIFDCRAFQVPNKAEAMNAVYWRQADGVRNSVQMLAQSLFSHRELQYKNQEDLKCMMEENRGVKWDSSETWKKLGTGCLKRDGRWQVNEELPVFKDNWEYLLKLI